MNSFLVIMNAKRRPTHSEESMCLAVLPFEVTVLAAFLSGLVPAVSMWPELL